jgi:hypothetical protein
MQENVEMDSLLLTNYYTTVLKYRIENGVLVVERVVVNGVEEVEHAAEVVGGFFLHAVRVAGRTIWHAAKTIEADAIDAALFVGHEVERGFHIVVAAAEVACADIHLAGHILVQEGAKLLLQVNDVIVGGVRFTIAELCALADAVELAEERLIIMLDALPEEIIDLLIKLDHDAVKVLRHVAKKIAEIPADIKLAGEELVKLGHEAVLDIAAANRWAEAVVTYYLHELVSIENIPFQFVGYDQKEGVFVVVVGNEKVVSILNGMFQIIHEQFRFVTAVTA